MKTKIIVKGINAFGYKFEIPGYLPEHLCHYNLHNYKRAHSFLVEVKTMNNAGEVVSKSIDFGSSCFNLPLESNSLYWTEIQFEDGSVLHNENEHYGASQCKHPEPLLPASHPQRLDTLCNHIPWQILRIFQDFLCSMILSHVCHLPIFPVLSALPMFQYL